MAAYIFEDPTKQGPSGGISCKIVLQFQGSKIAKGHASVKKTQSIKLTIRVSKLFRKTQTNELARQMPASAGPWRDKKGDPFGFLNIHCCKISKTWRGDVWEKKCHNAKKTERGDPLFLPGIVCYEEKRKNFFDSVR